MRRLDLQFETLSRGTLTACSPLSALPISRISPQHPLTNPFISPTRLLSNLLPLVTKFSLIFVHCQTPRVGSETQKAVCYIGYHSTVAQACIHLLSSRSLERPTFDLFPLILTILSSEPIGPMFSIVYGPNLSVPCTLSLCACHLRDLPAVVAGGNSRSYSLKILVHCPSVCKDG